MSQPEETQGDIELGAVTDFIAWLHDHGYWILPAYYASCGRSLDELREGQERDAARLFREWCESSEE